MKNVMAGSFRQEEKQEQANEKNFWGKIKKEKGEGQVERIRQRQTRVQLKRVKDCKIIKINSNVSTQGIENEKVMHEVDLKYYISARDG